MRTRRLATDAEQRRGPTVANRLCHFLCSDYAFPAPLFMLEIMPVVLNYADYAKIMPIMLNYAVYANVCSRDAKIMLNLRNYANYALCSDSAIMPKSNAGIRNRAGPRVLRCFESSRLIRLFRLPRNWE